LYLQLKEYPDIASTDSKITDTTLQSYLEDLSDSDLTEYLLDEKVLLKYVKVLDIRHKSSISSCCFTKAYTHYAEGTGSVLQHDSNQLLEEQYSKYIDSDDISYLKGLQLRYFTPREVANLMGFPMNFSFPDSMSNKTKYRLLGNSLNIKVVAMLYRILMRE